MKTVQIALYEFDKDVIDQLNKEYCEMCSCGMSDVPLSPFADFQPTWVERVLYCVAYKGFARLAFDDSDLSWYVREFLSRTAGEYYDFLAPDPYYEGIVVSHGKEHYVEP